MIVAGSWLMFGDNFHIRYLDNFLKLFDRLQKVYFLYLEHLDRISETFDSLNKMKTTSSESKGKLGRLGKGLVTALAFKTKVRFAKTKKGKI